MSGDLNLALDPKRAYVQGMPDGLCLLCQPREGPPNEIGSEEHTAFLEINGGFGADFDFMQVEDLFAFFNSGLDQLSAVIVVEPSGQILGDQVRAVME